jgi:GNAT superfamily N-acetyltransferase
VVAHRWKLLNLLSADLLAIPSRSNGSHKFTACQTVAAMLKIEPVKHESKIAVTQELLRGYFSWFFELVPGSDQVAAFSGWQEEIKTLPSCYFPPTGCFQLATLDGQAAGCIALKSDDPDTGEIKRMFVHPVFRGHKIGERLVEALFEQARAYGYKRVVLDSHSPMIKAHEIYRKLGFREVDSPSDFPEELRPVVVFTEREL